MSRETLKRHYSLLKVGMSQPKQSIGNIQYSLYRSSYGMMVYIEGSNEPKDWKFNLMYFGLFFHIGYVVMAHRFKNVLKGYMQVTIVGHSFGAGIASILYWLLGKHCKEAVLFGCPPSYTWLNPLVPKRMTSYRVQGDLVTHANIVRPLFRQAVKMDKLPTQADGVADNHSVMSYLAALEEVIF